VFPVLNGIFRSLYWSLENKAFDNAKLNPGDVRTILGLPWRIMHDPSTLTVAVPPGVFAVLLLPLLAYLVLGWRRHGGHRVAWIAVTVAVLAWWAEFRFLRYLLPYALISVPLASGLWKRPLTAAMSRRAAVLVLGAITAAAALFFASTLAAFWNVPGRVPPTDVAFGLESRGHYEHRAFAELTVMDAFKAMAKEGARAVTPRPNNRTYLGPEYDLVPDWVVNSFLAAPANRVPADPRGKPSTQTVGDQALAQFRSIGVEWVVLGYDDRSFAAISPSRRALLREHGDIRFAANGFDLYELVDEPGQRATVPLCDPDFMLQQPCWIGSRDSGSPGLSSAEAPNGAVQRVAACPGETLSVQLSARRRPATVYLIFTDANGATVHWPGEHPAVNTLTIAPGSHDVLHATAPHDAASVVIRVHPGTPDGVVDNISVTTNTRRRPADAPPDPLTRQCPPTQSTIAG
jgi:hypothetical protein